MQWGMKNRLNRIFKPNCVMLAVDHGYFMGPTSGLRNLGKTVEPLLEHADALMITRGAIRNWIPEEMDKPIILRSSGGPLNYNDIGFSILEYNRISSVQW